MTSEASVNRIHAEAILIEQQAQPTLRDLPLVHEPAFSSRIWSAFDTGILRHWTTEADLRALIFDTITDAINLAGLPPGTLRLVAELGLAQVRPDIWVLTESGVPVGVVEVKRPSSTIMDNKHVHGQIFDYMRCIKTFFGVKHVLGIVTTYTRWRFYWFEESDLYATADTCAAIKNLGGARKEDVVNSKEDSSEDDDGDGGGEEDDEEERDDDDGEEESDKEEKEDDDAENTDEKDDLNTTFTPASDDGALVDWVEEDESPRVLHGTKVYDAEQAGPELSVLLASVVYKMCMSPCIPIPALPSSVRICMNQVKWFWARVPATIQDVNDTAMPTIGSTRFFLLRDLRGGVDGRAWRACTTSGIGCAIKFSGKASAEDRRQCLEAEATVWRKAWAVDVRVATLAGEPALIMPYACAVKHQQLTDKAKQRVLDAISEMASNGYCHNDLHWRHVGRLKLKQRRQRPVIFFDLASVSRVDTLRPEAVTAAKAEMMDALKL